MDFFLKVCRWLVGTAYRWFWQEPVEARGPLWTAALWLAVLLGALITRKEPAFLVFLAVQWFMRKVGKPKLPARPVFRR